MKPDNPLLEMENVAITPHVGSASINTRNKMAETAAMNIVEFYKNGKTNNIVNPESID